MKRYLHPILLLLLLVTAGACSESGREQAAEKTEYTCPMHPQIVQHEPGTCPICKMDLVPRSAKGSEVAISPDLEFLLRPATGVPAKALDEVIGRTLKAPVAEGVPLQWEHLA